MLCCILLFSIYIFLAARKANNDMENITIYQKRMVSQTQSQSQTTPVSAENKPTTSPIQSPTAPNMTNNCCRNIDYSDPSKKIKTIVRSWNDCRPCNEVVPGCQYLPNADSCNSLAPLCKWSNNKCFNVKNTRTAETISCNATITDKTCIDYTKLAQYE